MFRSDYNVSSCVPAASELVQLLILSLNSNHQYEKTGTCIRSESKLVEQNILC